GSRVAVYWNRRAYGGAALWVIDMNTLAERYVAKGIIPLGWSAGSAAIYGTRAMSDKAEIVRVDLRTGAQTVVTRFPAGVIESGAVSRDGREIVCSLSENIADAWIIENFDPHRPPPPSPRR